MNGSLAYARLDATSLTLTILYMSSIGESFVYVSAKPAVDNGPYTSWYLFFILKPPLNISKSCTCPFGPIGNLVPDFLFNLETQDNPTCKYPREEMRTSLVPVKGLVHHSFCSPRLCDGIFLLPMSYNQKIEACEATRSLDARGAEIPWSQRKKKLFWRGANKGKKSEYYFFDWKFSDMPRQRAIRLLQKRKDYDVKFGFVSWLEFVQH